MIASILTDPHKIRVRRRLRCITLECDTCRVRIFRTRSGSDIATPSTLWRMEQLHRADVSGKKALADVQH